MRLFGLSPNGSLIAFLLSILLISHVVAQDLPKLPGNNDDNNDDNKAAATTGDSKDNKPAATTGDSAAATSDSKNTDTAKTTDAAKSTDSASPTDKTTSKTSDQPGLSGLPKLKGADYPPPSVPPTAGAPFMQKSTLPEGTVFICVGAALGFIGFMVMAWRGFLAWSVHQSVKRAANAHIVKLGEKDPLRSLKTKGPYMSPGPGSTLSLDQLAGGKGGGKVNSSRNSLFFSPTAGAGMNSPSHRGSGYLPSGYYAAGNSAPAGGGNMTHIGGGVPLSNLGNGARRYSRATLRDETPPRSPALPPSRDADSMLNGSRLSTQGLAGHASNSSLNLNVAPQGRAPSAYLEDLFENHPPGAPPTEQHKRHSRR